MLRTTFFVVLLVFVSVSLSYAAPADVPKTGQTTISATGDDGDKKAGVAWPSARFTTNADTTITDNLTSLVWAPDAGTPTVTGTITCTGGVKKWLDNTVTPAVFPAVAYVACLNTNNYLGHTDWRLPNINELESLVHAEYTRETCGGSACTTNAMWLNTQGFSDTVQADYYWSSTTYAANTTVAWYVYMYDGLVLLVNKTDDNYVWPVRSGQ